MPVSLSVDTRALAHAAGALERDAAVIARDLALLTQHRARALRDAMAQATPVSQPQGDEPEHTPHMRDLWREQTTGEMEATVSNEAPYALWQVTGTHDHWVQPVHADALHFWSGGEEHFSRGHMVRGISPNPQLLHAIDDQQAKAAEEMRIYGEQIVARLAVGMG